MKIGCFVYGSVSRNRKDQWVTGRCEVRMMFNVAYGLRAMGHNVDIIWDNFDKNLEQPDGPNFVYLSDVTNINNNYDILIVYGVRPGTIPDNFYRKMFYMLEPSMDPTDMRKLISDFPKARFFVVSKLAKDITSKVMGRSIGYFPLLFPITCLGENNSQLDFKPFEFDKEKKDLNIWAFITGWANYHISCDARIVEVLNRINSYGKYNIKLTLHVNSQEPRGKNYIASLSNSFNTRIIENENMCYLDMVNLLATT